MQALPPERDAMPFHFLSDSDRLMCVPSIILHQSHPLFPHYPSHFLLPEPAFNLAQVLGDPDRLRGILLNLYTNAAKFTKRGAIALRVLVTGPNYRRVMCSCSQHLEAS